MPKKQPAKKLKTVKVRLEKQNDGEIIFEAERGKQVEMDRVDYELIKSALASYGDALNLMEAYYNK